MKFSYFKLFALSAVVTIAVLFLACFFWTDFKKIEVANVMFWVGAITIIAGGSFFYPRNKYQGLSVSIMTTLKDAPLENLDTIRIKEKRKTKRMIQGLSIATPGIILMIISWFIYS